MEKNFLSYIINKIFFFQEKFLEGKYNKKMNKLNYSNGSLYKSHMTKNATLTLSVALEKRKEKVKREIKKLVYENKENLYNLLDYVENSGNKIFFIKNASKLLKPIKEKEGLILPKKGLFALYINLLTTKKISFSSDTMLIFEKAEVSPYNLLYNFYKWYLFTRNLPGFDEKSVSKLKNLDDFDNPQIIESLSYEDIIKLRQSIDQDREAMEFTLEFMKELEGSKKAFDIIKNKDNGANI